MKSLLISSLHFPPQKGGISSFMACVAATLGSRKVCCLTGVPRAGALCNHMLEAATYRRPTAFAKPRGTQAAAFAATMLEIMVRERPQAVQLATAYDGY